jgi:hypothetical protein
MRNLQKSKKEAGAGRACQAGGELSYLPFYHMAKQDLAAILDDG